MRILTFLSFMIVMGSFGVGCDTTSAAVPVRVDVHTVTIDENRNSDPTIHVYAVDEAGNAVTFGGLANYFLSFTNDEPFSVPATVSTNGFDDLNMVFGNQVSTGRFTVSSAYSDPLKLWMTNTPRKPDTFSRTGNAGFHASFHFTGQGGTEFFDDDVELVGTYQVDLRWAGWLSGRRIQFYKLHFDLKKPE